MWASRVPRSIDSRDRPLARGSAFRWMIRRQDRRARRRDVSRNCSNLAGLGGPGPGLVRELVRSQLLTYLQTPAVRCLIADILAKRAEGTHGGLAVWSSGREESADSILTHSLPLSFSLSRCPSFSTLTSLSLPFPCPPLRPPSAIRPSTFPRHFLSSPLRPPLAGIARDFCLYPE